MFPGSFDPFTRGHQSLVDRGLQLFDAVVIAVGISTKKPVTEEEIVERLAPIRALYAAEPRVEVTHYTGLTVDAARNAGCSFLLRGIRNAIDMEYERSLADVNRSISGIETIFLFTLPELSAISSSMVRELERYGHDVDDFMPLMPQ
ncbi:MAG: pantetheine-phosphate adenylyltransferase [Muribaculaceae bacterium]|nr:pantetheine-phosphate adenylyltransferase [Muribaculaceae bacterium]